MLIGLTHMHRSVAGASIGWRVPPGIVAELALAELNPARALPTPTEVNARFGGVVFFFFFLLAW